MKLYCGLLAQNKGINISLSMGTVEVCSECMEMNFTEIYSEQVSIMFLGSSYCNEHNSGTLNFAECHSKNFVPKTTEKDNDIKSSNF